jgi:hypothetical protein
LVSVSESATRVKISVKKLNSGTIAGQTHQSKKGVTG